MNLARHRAGMDRKLDDERFRPASGRVD